jgi:HD-GYP domain-containing protein (c-di-GMP phosphodiesterase class II)
MTKPWFDFDINDPVFQEIIKPFIIDQMKDMALYDRKRQAVKPDIKYIFHEHAERVAQDVKGVAARLGQPENVQDAMYWAMLAHDLGKKTLPIEIWDSEEKPTGDVKKMRRSHAERGLAILDEGLGDLDHPFMALLRDVMTNHHENMDGSGHHGLKAGEISMPVRLCCIVESYDGYTIPRPHFGERDISPRAVLEKMRTEPDKGAKMFDMDLFEAFARMKLDGQSPAPTTTKAPGMKDR